jgi:hypothetical protein
VKLFFLILREEHGLWMFGCKGEEVTGGRMKLQNGELCDLYFSPNIIRVCKSMRMIWSGQVLGEM